MKFMMMERDSRVHDGIYDADDFDSLVDYLRKIGPQFHIEVVKGTFDELDEADPRLRWIYEMRPAGSNASKRVYAGAVTLTKREVVPFSRLRK